eukprot:CAMPEP_0201272676 /NCGR_PEP_ID=MMETSP0853-20130426/42124_1 /ASSEMBLY_ACC=CAM_ASM_000640 /TAXON_ID=183588 /ORGANISM="Pseudo-nitzschia fraudulenta, Strain WWA7" /LENGTH=35 /DNA_ID= /DNA_START= /DNA_END= /DNA_ORIENTATION=
MPTAETSKMFIMVTGERERQGFTTTMAMGLMSMTQ